MNSFVRKAIWLIGTAAFAIWPGGQGALGQNNASASPQIESVQILQIQRKLEGADNIEISANTNDEVYAGESVEVKLNLGLSKINVRIDADKTWTLLQRTESDRIWKLLIPARLSNPSLPISVHTFAFYGNLASDPDARVFCGSSAMTVYPAPDARVEHIEQRALDPKISDVQYLTVTGEGFFAPLNQIHLTVGGRPATNKGISANGKHLYAEFNAQNSSGIQPVRLEIWDTVAAFTNMSAEQIQIERDADGTTSLLIAGIGFLVMAAFVLALAGRRIRLRLPWALETILLEKPNNTYSLSCFQFYWWGSITILSWLFLFAARGILANDWRFPGLAGFAFTLAISLATLILAQIANAARGLKGSGAVHPSLSDLILQGGVVAPERVQLFACSVLSGIAYIVILIKSYQTIAALPVIPNELLVIMGISSLGYIGGKFARKPGPIISQITSKSNRDLFLAGSKLSVQPRIWLNGMELPPSSFEAVQFDSRFPQEFAVNIHISLPASPDFIWFNPASPADARTLKLMNADGQFSEWHGIPTPPARASEWVDAPPLQPEVASFLPDIPSVAPVMITTPPEMILKAAYRRQPEAENESDRVTSSE